MLGCDATGDHRRAGEADIAREADGLLGKGPDDAVLACRPQRVLDRVRAGEDDPKCRDCGGILKSDTISFGQQLVPEVIDRAMRAAAEADLLFAVGTSLQVYPIAGAFDLARSAGAKTVIMNAQPTPFDSEADAVLPGSISELLPLLLKDPKSVSRSLN